MVKREYLPGGTNGKLLFQGKLLCYTIELAWRDNLRRVSCIPEGRYRLRKRYSRKFQWHLEVTKVRHRDLILIHPANDAQRELNGCIAPVGLLTGEGKGLDSRRAMERLKKAVFPLLDRGLAVYLNLRKKQSDENNL